MAVGLLSRSAAVPGLDTELEWDGHDLREVSNVLSALTRKLLTTLRRERQASCRLIEASRSLTWWSAQAPGDMVAVATRSTGEQRLLPSVTGTGIDRVTLGNPTAR